MAKQLILLVMFLLFYVDSQQVLMFIDRLVSVGNEKYKREKYWIITQGITLEGKDGLLWCDTCILIWWYKLLFIIELICPHKSISNLHSNVHIFLIWRIRYFLSWSMYHFTWEKHGFDSRCPHPLPLTYPVPPNKIHYLAWRMMVLSLSFSISLPRKTSSWANKSCSSHSPECREGCCHWCGW